LYLPRVISGLFALPPFPFSLNLLHLSVWRYSCLSLSRIYLWSIPFYY
jgi:hypothetical protein